MKATHKMDATVEIELQPGKSVTGMLVDGLRKIVAHLEKEPSKATYAPGGGVVGEYMQSGFTINEGVAVSAMLGAHDIKTTQGSPSREELHSIRIRLADLGWLMAMQGHSDYTKALQRVTADLEYSLLPSVPKRCHCSMCEFHRSAEQMADTGAPTHG